MELIKKEKITFAEIKILGFIPWKIKFWLSSDLDESIIDKYQAFINLNPNDLKDEYEAGKKVYTIGKEIIIAVLCQDNSKRKVIRFVNKLRYKGIQELFTFINNYIKEANEEKKKD